MKLYGYIHAHTGEVRIVTRRALPERKGQWANDLVWGLSRDHYYTIFKVMPHKKNVREAATLAAQLGLHRTIKSEHRGKGHQSWVWSRGNWLYCCTVDTGKVRKRT